ncbi:MAG: hypothetical protein LBC68_15420 [Prevotellaceae bacterium]|nr:hypothetical protein [Prevotellaceae bacterium]
MPTRYIDLRKLIYMDFLITRGCTGNAEEFAKRLNISRSTFFEYKACLRDDFSAEIEYFPLSNTYRYTKKPKPVSIIQFADEKIIEEMEKFIKGNF